MTQTPLPAEAPVCIIGAGSSGLVSAKALRERGIACEVFEKGSDLGGMWRYENDNGVSSAYRSLHIDTSRKSLGYPDFPLPDDLPDFLSHAQVLAHLERYADRFELRPLIRFRHEVLRVEPRAGGGWAVTVRRLAGASAASAASAASTTSAVSQDTDVQTRHYRAVLVANGHLWSPRMAEFAGHFDGEQLHSHHYRTATPFEGRHVLVVGIGNSAVDIAVDLARQAASVTISTRRGAWVMPKYILGIPTDRWGAAIARWTRLPTPWVRRIVGQLMKLTVGDQARYGMPRPAHPIWREHACVSQDLLPYIGHGWIGIKPDVRELCGREVAFVDGSRVAMDTIIHATGYRTVFPFLDPAVFEVRDHAVALYRRIAAVKQPGLYFMGLVQPIGPTIPLVEVQARWVAGVLAGAVALPPPEAMRAEIAAHQRALDARYVRSARYTLEVDFREHAAALRGDLAAAARRVRGAPA